MFEKLKAVFARKKIEEITELVLEDHLDTFGRVTEHLPPIAGRAVAMLVEDREAIEQIAALLGEVQARITPLIEKIKDDPEIKSNIKRLMAAVKEAERARNKRVKRISDLVEDLTG